MKKLRKMTSIFCAVGILLMMTAPTVSATVDSRWVEKAPIPSARILFDCANESGKIYVTGGWMDGSDVNILSIYNTADNSWTTGENMPTERENHVSEALDGKIYVIGGCNKQTLDIYNIATDTWTTGAPMPQARAAASSVVLDGKIYVIGGVCGGQTLGTMDIYNPANDTWATGISIPSTIAWHESEVINGKIYVIGGRQNGTESNQVQIFDPETNSWTTGAPMPESRMVADSVCIDNNIYIIGGQYIDGNEIIIRESVYIYDSLADSWSVGTPLTQPRYSMGASVINSIIYTVGGQEGAGVTNVVETLDLNPVEHKLSVMLNAGETSQLSVSNNLLTNSSMTWISSDEAVATVNANGNVTAVGEGSCEITAKNSNNTWSESFPVKVFAPNRLALHLNVGETKRLYLTENPADTTWTSLNTAVVTVDATGKVEAVSEGLSIVEATVDGETYQIYVRVKG